MKRLDQIHLYQGNLCNRACPFCTVNGSPSGWFREHSPEAIALAVRLVKPGGVIKIYGGEPTMQPEATARSMRAIRQLGFAGPIYLFSNGDDAEALIQLLDASPPTAAVLNYSVWIGRDARPLAHEARAAILEYDRQHPGAIIRGHEEYYASGRAASLDIRTRAECPRCMPAIFPDGRVHACPFAVESALSAYWLGDAHDPPEVIVRRVERFLEWLDGPHARLAHTLGVDACTVCERHLHRLPPP